MDSLTIFMPFYNDGGTVNQMVTDAHSVGRSLTKDLEVIAVNDGSADHTLNELGKMKKKYPELRIVNHQQNKGYGGALISGIKNSTKDWVFYTDGDGQYHLDELTKLWAMRRGTDVVNGYKLARSDSLLRKAVGSIYARLMGRLFSMPIRDVDCDYRLMKGPLLRSLKLRSSSGAITVELVHSLHKAGAKFSEVGVSHYPRVYGRSTFFTPSRVLKSLIDDLKILVRAKKLAKKSKD